MVEKVMKPGVILSALFLAFAVSPVQSDVIVDGTALPKLEVKSIKINPANGDITIVTTGNNWQITQSDSNVNRPAVDLRVNNSGSGATVDVDTAVSMSWNVSGADSCAASGGGNSSWAGSNIGLPSGSRSVTVKDVGSQVYTLTCTNIDGSTVDSVTVTGNQVDVPPPTPDGCPAVSNLTVMDWDELTFGGGSVDWPQLAGVNARLEQGPSETVAIRFNTSTADDVASTYGKVGNTEVAGVPGARQISIAECPGQFTNLPRRCVTGDIISTGAVYWELDNTRGYSHTCKLDQGATGETYYVNVRFPSGCGSQSTCESWVSPYYY